MEKDTVYTVLPRNWRIPKINCMYIYNIYIYHNLRLTILCYSSFGYPKPQLGRCPFSVFVLRRFACAEGNSSWTTWDIYIATVVPDSTWCRGHEGPPSSGKFKGGKYEKNTGLHMFTTMTHSWLRGLNGLNRKTNGGQLLMRTHSILGTNHEHVQPTHMSICPFQGIFHLTLGNWGLCTIEAWRWWGGIAVTCWLHKCRSYFASNWPTCARGFILWSLVLVMYIHNLYII